MFEKNLGNIFKNLPNHLQCWKTTCNIFLKKYLISDFPKNNLRENTFTKNIWKISSNSLSNCQGCPNSTWHASISTTPTMHNYGIYFQRKKKTMLCDCCLITMQICMALDGMLLLSQSLQILKTSIFTTSMINNGFANLSSIIEYHERQ